MSERAEWECLNKKKKSTGKPCGKKWTPRGSNDPTRCPDCGSFEIRKVPENQDEEVHAPAEPDPAEAANDVEVTVHREPDGEVVKEVSPKPQREVTTQTRRDKIVSTLRDIGIRFGRETMADQYLNGDIDDLDWLALILKEGGLDMHQRKMAIMSITGRDPTAEGVDLSNPKPKRYQMNGNAEGGLQAASQKPKTMDEFRRKLEQDKVAALDEEWVQSQIDAAKNKNKLPEQPNPDDEYQDITYESKGDIKKIPVKKSEVAHIQLQIEKMKQKEEELEKETKWKEANAAAKAEMKERYETEIKRMNDEHSEAIESLQEEMEKMKEVYHQREVQLTTTINEANKRISDFQEAEYLQKLTEAQALIKTPEQMVQELEEKVKAARALGMIKEEGGGDAKTDIQKQLVDKVSNQLTDVKDTALKIADKWVSFSREQQLLQQGKTPEEIAQATAPMDEDRRKEMIKKAQESGAAATGENVQTPQNFDEAQAALKASFDQASVELQAQADIITKEAEQLEAQKIQLQELQKQNMEALEQQKAELERMKDEIIEQKNKPPEVPISEPPKGKDEGAECPTGECKVPDPKEKKDDKKKDSKKKDKKSKK